MTKPNAIRLAFLILAIPTLITGVWALFAPGSWYGDFPGTNLGWVQAFGPYNEHFVQDIGGAYLGFGGLLLFAAARFTPVLGQGAAIGYLIFAIPHLVVHVFVRSGLSTSAYAGTIAPLAFSVGLATWVGFESRRAESDRQST